MSAKDRALLEGAPHLVARRRAARRRGGRGAHDRDRGQAVGGTGPGRAAAGALRPPRRPRGARGDRSRRLRRRRGDRAPAAASTAGPPSPARAAAPVRARSGPSPDAGLQRRDARPPRADRPARGGVVPRARNARRTPAPRWSRRAGAVARPGRLRNRARHADRAAGRGGGPPRAVLVGGYYGSWLPPEAVASARLDDASLARWGASARRRRARGAAGRCVPGRRGDARGALAGRRERRAVRPVRARPRRDRRAHSSRCETGSAGRDVLHRLDRWSGQVDRARRLPSPRRRRALPGAARSRSSPASSPTIAATGPATTAAVPGCSACPTGAGGPRHEPAADRGPDRLQRPRRVRRAVPRADPARRLGLPDPRRPAGARAPPRPRAPRRGGVPDARAAAGRHRGSA